jgi:serine phosphatase RsbU (regulator of sigma subunit)
LVALLARVNSGMADSLPEGSAQHVEAGVVLPGEKRIEWASAGRCPGALISRDGVLTEFSSHGPPLGMLGGFLYGTQEVELGAGDAVLVLSGASQGVFRGATDLVAALQGKPVAEIVTTVQIALKKSQPDTALESSVLLLRKQ